MNQLILNQLKDGLKEISDNSFPLCEMDDIGVSQKGAKINSKAHELRKMLDYFFEQSED